MPKKFIVLFIVMGAISLTISGYTLKKAFELWHKSIVCKHNEKKV